MAIPDLPVELWLEILSLLPRSTLHKMIGINRVLFELAMDDIYQEVRFINDDKEMVKCFKQLKHASIANRVQHLVIRPAFLPGMDEHPRTSFRQNISSGFTYFKNHLGRSPSTDTPEVLDTSLSSKILDAASKAVKFCPNLRELTIVLYDHALTQPFTAFLNSLWTLDSVAPNLRKINIDTTLAKIPLLLKPLAQCSTFLSGLEEIDISLSVTRFPQTLDYFVAKQALLFFFTAFKETLKAVTLSSSLVIDLSYLFKGFPLLPKLRKVELLAIFQPTTFPNVGSLTRFLTKHASTLEHLVVRPGPRSATHERSDETYLRWLNPRSQPSSDKQHGFPQLVLPALRTLDLSLRQWSQVGRWLYNEEVGPGRLSLPPLSQVTPNIRSLNLSDFRLSLVGVSEIIKNLARRDGGAILEALNVSIETLSHQHFDLFASELPRLLSLKVDYMGNVPLFFDAIQARRYSSWSLRYLRLTRPSHRGCPVSDPDTYLAPRVAKSFPDSLVVDTSRDIACQCSHR